MIIKEYRIPLPMTVEEYRIAQLYMIQVGRGAARACLAWRCGPGSPVLPRRPLVNVRVALGSGWQAQCWAHGGTPWMFVALDRRTSAEFTAF